MFLRIRDHATPERTEIAEPFSLVHGLLGAAAPLIAVYGPVGIGWTWFFAVSVALGLIGWGYGYRLTADASGLEVATTFYGIRVRRRRFSRAVQFGFDDPPSGGKQGVWVAELPDHKDEVSVAGQRTCDRVFDALREAATRHQWECVGNTKAGSGSPTARR